MVINIATFKIYNGAICYDIKSAMLLIRKRQKIQFHDLVKLYFLALWTALFRLHNIKRMG